MKYGEAELWLRQQLQNLYSDGESSNIADWVMEKITGCTKLERTIKSNETLVAGQARHLSEITQRLQHHEPVQYILNEVYFYGLKLYVDKNVLIPRPETEELVDWIIKDIRATGIPVFEKGPVEADATTTLKILDVGTGSGCIALALKNCMPIAEVWGCDTSDEALTVARRNGSELDIRVDFVGLNFLDQNQTSQLPTVDILVSNPPYIPQKDSSTMNANVVDHEPHTALFVPDNNALVFYLALAEFGKKRLYNGGTIYAEIHEDLGPAVVQLFEEKGYRNVILKKDMQGKNRMVKAEKQ